MSTYTIDAQLPAAVDALGRVTMWQPMRGTFTTLDEYYEGLDWVADNGGRVLAVS